ncbi:MAG: hypothetical protein V4726_08985 [Verrucomicrobiota bacterium]
MTVPILIALWRCACGTLDIYADQQWSEVRKLAESHEVDIDHAMDPIPVVPAAENFMSQPYLQACLFDPEGETVNQMAALAEKCRGPLIDFLPSLDAGSTARLSAVLSGIRKAAPEFMPVTKAKEPTAETLLRVTDGIGIPWSELDEATGLLHAQMPPWGATPPTDDYTPPLVFSVSSGALIRFSRIATLRTHAALALKQPGPALASLRIQSRMADAHFHHATLASTIFGSFFVQNMISQIHAGFRSRQWTEADIAWFAEWAGKIDFLVLLNQASKMECIYSIRYAESLRTDPGFEDRMLRSIAGDPAVMETLSEAAMPFQQDWLAPFRGNSEFLYRLAPRGAFTLLEAQSLMTYFDDYLSLLKKGGLHEYAWQAKENRVSSKVISYPQLGAGFAAHQSRINLLRTACALHQWHAAHGDYPKVLEGLQPGLPESACLDVCSGKPLHYERVSRNSYRLRAVGVDRIDDGGKPMAGGKGDIVWK